MADTVGSQILEQGERNLVYKFTNKSDGTGENAVIKVDVSTLDPACDRVSILKIEYDINGMEVELIWDADTDVTALKLSDGQGELEFCKYGGIYNNSGSGRTGDLKLTTSNQQNGSSYSMIVHFKKKYGA